MYFNLGQYIWYDTRVYKLEEQSDWYPVVGNENEVKDKLKKAIEKSLEWRDIIHIGVFYKNETIPSFEEKISQTVPSYYQYYPSSQPIDIDGKLDTLIDGILKEKKVED